MSDGGKGSAPRPFSVSHDEYDKRWDYIFRRDLKEENDNTGTSKNEYYDSLTTEDALTELSRANQELGLSYETDTPENNPLIKK